jgi:hypothetical protein
MKPNQSGLPRFLSIIGCLLLLPIIATFGEDSKADDPGPREQFSEKDLPTDEPDPAGLSEIEELAQARGFRYGRDTRQAVRGDSKALKAFFQLAHDADGAAAESISGVPAIVYHLLGDEKFAAFLAAQPLAFQMMVRNDVVSGDPSSRSRRYFARYFPRTADLFFRAEIVDWVSPDGAYAIRKVFNDEPEFANSKVLRAEIIERKSARVLCDLTADDIGKGAAREGEALWSPDSRRVACLSSDLTEPTGNLFSTPRPAPLRKQTAVYQLAGDRFAKVDVQLREPEEVHPDEELANAVLGHTYTEPVRWEKPNVLILENHNYYEKKVPFVAGGQTFHEIKGFGRLYQIKMRIEQNGVGKATWKLVDQ